MKATFKPAGLPAAALAFALLAGPANAGNAPPAPVHGQMPHPMMPHGMTSPGMAQEQPPRLGVALSAVSADDLDGMSLEYGVRISEVLAGSVAERAGVRPGDVVTEFDGRPAYSPERLKRIVGEADGTTTVALVRDGEALKLPVSFDAAAAVDGGEAYLGIRIQAMTDDLKEAFGAQGNAGVLVSQVVKESAAARAGVKAGDVLVSIGGKQVASLQDVHAALDEYAAGDTVEVSILRDRQASTLRVALDAAPGDMQSHAMHPHAWGDHHGRGYDPHHPPGMMWGQGCHMGKGQRSS